MEKDLIPGKGIKFIGINAGKLRRYFDIQNFFDGFRIVSGLCSAYFALQKIKPDIVFSKGGYVALPVVLAASLLGIKIIIHESDAISGLATKLSAPFAERILLAFSEAKNGLKKYNDKIEIVGSPIRTDLFFGKKENAQKITGFKRDVLLVMGGSLGSEEINQLVIKNKKMLEKYFDVVHVTGERDSGIVKEKHYYKIGFLSEEIGDFLALASLALTRAGAGALSELSALEVPSLLHPLGLKASRGDQIANAEAAIKKHNFFALYDQKKDLITQLQKLPKRKPGKHSDLAAKKIAKIILKAAAQKTTAKNSTTKLK